jgi:hypothetical protein
VFIKTGEIRRIKIVRCLLRQEILKGEIQRSKIVRCLLRQEILKLKGEIQGTKK